DRGRAAVLGGGGLPPALPREARARDVHAAARRRVVVSPHRPWAPDSAATRRVPVKAVVWHGDERLSVDDVPEPRIEQPTDAVVRITSTAICGSDLHLYGAKVVGMK